MGLIDKVKRHFQKEPNEASEICAAPAIKEQLPVEDLPSTVQPLTTDARHVAELRGAFAGQKWD